ncbi:VanZ family protein [Desulfococcus sp.]|uniref:VanZ family protein n=1 Tax=Desulfococcus sp. TaxID=2025834 RepID=UPI003594061B
MTLTFKRFLGYWLPVILYCLLIFVQSSFPSPVASRGVPMADKLLHLLGYALLAALFFRAHASIRPEAPLRRTWVSSVLFTSLYGAMDEFHQAFVPSRSADAADLLADTAGAVIGAGLCCWLAPRWPGSLKKSRIDKSPKFL